MRFGMHLTAALLVVIAFGGIYVSAADRDPRAEVAGREKIREELTAALAKGHLTRMDQYHILLHAKEVLNADDLHGLEQTLDRLATRPGAALPAAPAARRAAPVQADTADGQPEDVRPSKYEEPDAERIPPGDAVPHKAKRSGESPFVEEDPSTIGKPAMHPDEENAEGCGCDTDQCEQWCRACRRWVDVDCFTSVDGFKGPIDIDNANGNFGVKFGINGAVALLPRLGIGLQAGTSEVLSNLKGSPFPEPNATNRSQEFVTVGMFQRINREEGAFIWGFAYDWLFDQYYSDFNFGQWRVKGAWEFNPCDEMGISAAIADHGSSGEIPDFFGGTDVLHFKPISEGYLYWKHTWCNEASLTAKAGVAERPGEFVFGGESRVPVTKNLALTSDFTYIMPNASGGAVGQTEEIWNLSFGIEFVPGGFGRCGGRFQPFLPVADNGSMAVRELAQ